MLPNGIGSMINRLSTTQPPPITCTIRSDDNGSKRGVSSFSTRANHGSARVSTDSSALRVIDRFVRDNLEG